VTEWRLTQYETLPSTSDLCIALARAGEPDGLAVLARRQTQGRGSRGRSWESPPGNLYVSMLLRPTGDALEAGRWALLAGVALAEALEHRLDGAKLQLKWPNDVLLAGRKLAGILIDSALHPDGRLEWLVIGFGANLVRAPVIPGRQQPATLADAGVASTPEIVAARLLERLRHWQRVRLVEGFGSLREAWLERAHPVGTQLTVRFAGQVLTGTFAGLDDDGSLLLQGAGGMRRLPTAEILTARE
jgi:BirA family biotin operon repressor/biotin-[acetyl-CoA-carboxylase] ligase